MGLLDGLGKLLGQAKNNLVGNTKGAVRQVNPFDGGATWSHSARKPYVPKPIDKNTDKYYQASHMNPRSKLALVAQLAGLASSDGVPELPNSPQIFSIGRPTPGVPPMRVQSSNIPIPRNQFYEDEIDPRQVLQPTSYNNNQTSLNGQLLQGPLSQSNPVSLGMKARLSADPRFNPHLLVQMANSLSALPYASYKKPMGK